MNKTESNLPKWIAATLVVGAFLLADFFTPLSMEDEPTWPAFVLLGVCIAQINLTAVWAAMAPGNVAVRLPWALLLSVFMWYALVLGNRVAASGVSYYSSGGGYSYSYGYSLDEAVELGVILLFGVIAAQIPLWIASRVFRWRLVGWTDKREVAAGRLQFQIWHMMLGTLFVALALSPAKTILPPGRIENLDLDGLLFVVLGGVAVCNLLVTVPCVWAAFWSKKRLPAAAACWLVYCGLLTGVEFGFFCAVVGSPLASDSVPFQMYLLNLTQCGVVLGTLLIFRAVGLRLVRLPREGPTPEEVKEVDGPDEVEAR